MGLFHRYDPMDRVYIAPVEVQQEQPSEDQTGILFCDSKGLLTVGLIETSLMEALQHHIKKLCGTGKGAAAVCLEVAKGRSVSFTIEISAEEADALHKIHLSAREGFTRQTGRIPDTLKKYPQKIITAARNEYKKQQFSEISILWPTQEELVTGEIRMAQKPPERFLVAAEPWQEELIKGRTFDVTWSSSKDAPVYPAVILRKLPPNEQTRPGMQRVLALDAEGDICIFRVANEGMLQVEQDLETLKRAHNTGGVVVFSGAKSRTVMRAIGIRKSQEKALQMFVQECDRTGHSMKPVPMDVRAILAGVKEAVAGASLGENGS